MGVFDQGARYLCKLNPPGFFRWRVPRYAARFRFVGWQDASRITFPGEPDRICDTVAEFAATETAGLLTKANPAEGLPCPEALSSTPTAPTTWAWWPSAAT